jgi:putative transposase
LNAFCIVSERQLDQILAVGQSWYNERRGHSGRDNLPPVHSGEDPPTVDLAKQKVVCQCELGGQLKSYQAVA